MLIVMMLVTIRVSIMVCSNGDGNNDCNSCRNDSDTGVCEKTVLWRDP